MEQLKRRKCSNSGDGDIDRETIGPQRRESIREKITKKSRTRIGGDYFSNKRRGI
jgi:hypothetical protein